MAEGDHPLVERSESLLQRLGEIKNPSEEDAPLVIQATAGLEHLVHTIRGANPLLLSVKALDVLSDDIGELEATLPALEGAETTRSTAEFRTSLDHLLYAVTDVVTVSAPEDLDPVRSAIGAMKDFSEQHIGDLQIRLDQAEKQRQALAENLSQATTDFEAKREALNASVSELSAAIKAQKNELDTALASYASLYETEQQKRAVSFTTKLDEMVSAHAAAEEEMVKSGEASVTDVRKRADAILADINKRKKEVEATAEAVGLAATITGFAKDADEQKKAADIWRVVSVVSLLAIVFSGITTLIWVDLENLSLQQSLVKGSAGVALAVLAGYAGKQSGHHRQEERRSRKLALEVHAFDPYVANLDAERQGVLKEFMALRVFGHLDDAGSGGDKWDSAHKPSVQQVIDVLSPKKERAPS